MNRKKSWIYGAHVILSGASDGIGKELAVRLIRDFNCTVTGIARNNDKLLAVKQSLGEKSDAFTCLSADVSDKNTWTNLALSLDKADILINNAGIMPPFIPLSKTDEEVFRRTLEVNLFSAYYSCHTLLPLLKKSERGSIINVSSSASLCPLPGTATYSASKSALKAMTIALASEESDLFVSYVCPGFTKTNLFSGNGDIFESKLVCAISTSVKRMVNKIIKGMLKKKKRMVFGNDAHLMSAMHKIAPVSSAPIIKKIMKISRLPVFTELFDDE